MTQQILHGSYFGGGHTTPPILVDIFPAYALFKDEVDADATDENLFALVLAALATGAAGDATCVFCTEPKLGGDGDGDTAELLGETNLARFEFDLETDTEPVGATGADLVGAGGSARGDDGDAHLTEIAGVGVKSVPGVRGLTSDEVGVRGELEEVEPECGDCSGDGDGDGDDDDFAVAFASTGKWISLGQSLIAWLRI
jgi:hypothetical protein